MREGQPAPKPQPRLPKVLTLDIETAKMICEVWTYSLKQRSDYLDPMTIKRDIFIVCAAWKWLGENYVASTSVLNDKERFEKNYADDYHVVKTIYDLISEADIVIGHNIQRFDWRVFTSRCIAHGMMPPPLPKFIDTLKIARKEFQFSSNQLRYLARFLGVEDKDRSPDWELVARGDPQEIGYCEQYNRQDVRTTEAVYEKLKPYATNHPNIKLFLTGQHHIACPTCNGPNMGRRGYIVAQAKKYQRWQCSDCGAWTDERKVGSGANA